MMFAYLPIQGRTRHNLVKKNKHQTLTYQGNSTYAKLAPDPLKQSKKIKEITLYTGGGGHSISTRLLHTVLTRNLFFD